MTLSQRRYFPGKRVLDLFQCDDITKYPFNSLSGDEWAEIMHYIKRAEVEVGATGISRELPSTHSQDFLLYIALSEYKRLAPQQLGTEWNLFGKAMGLLYVISEDYEVIDTKDPRFNPGVCENPSFTLAKKRTERSLIKDSEPF